MQKLSIFSKLESSMLNFEQEAEQRKLSAISPPWSEKESKKTEVDKRVKKAMADFWEFDRIYFSEDMYDVFAKPCDFHKDLLEFCLKSGVDIVPGPRKHAKTAMVKKITVWLLLTNRIQFGATVSSTMKTSENILNDIAYLLNTERIVYDFKVEFGERNSKQFTIRTAKHRKLRKMIVLAEKKSARGASSLFNRLQFIYVDDLETRQSPTGDDQVKARIKTVQESVSSMSIDGSVIYLGNNFDENTALNTFVEQSNQGILPKGWRVHVYKAWTDENKPLWEERFPAKSENELKTMVLAASESEWQGDYQQKPVPDDGFIFSREGLDYYYNLPPDSRGVIYVDPNLAKKGKGDSTAIVSLLYSAKENLYFIDNLVCRSFSDSNKLLDSILIIKNNRHSALGFDGHVNQESTWTNNVRNYSIIKNVPFPYIVYCRYHTDDLAKNIQAVWNSGKIKLNIALADLPDTKTFLSQIFAFAGKKANRADDAPDSLICAFELIHQRRIVKNKSTKTAPIVINDHYC
jgi:hypothetical protein